MINLKRQDGTVTPMRNAKYLPAFFLIPEGIRSRCGARINAIPREIRRLWADRSAHETIESDLFLLTIVDAYAYMVWPFITPDAIQMEVYSGYDPVWKIAHQPEYWIMEMQEWGILPRTEQIFHYPADYTFPIIPEKKVYDILSFIVPRAMMRHNLWGVVQAAKECRCFEDFDYRNSNQKIDFVRQWYRTRTKHPQVSYEKFQEDWQREHHGREWDVADLTVKSQDEIAAEMDIARFVETLSEKDRQILELRRKGKVYEDIAKAVGYRTHSAVGKRLRKIGEAYENFAGIDLGYREK